MKISHAFILVLVLSLWVVPCSAGNKKITYYDPNGNILTKEMYLEISGQRNKYHVKDTELKAQLYNFLRDYCQTFENKNLNKFKEYFTADAMEKDKSFSSLLPKYRKIFEKMDSISYQIDLLEHFQEIDAGIIDIHGKFYVKFLLNGAGWKENSGWISMSLVKQDDSYRIKRLDYYVEI